ncbi:hypothetical protein N7494_011120 [Penicillium frequentans]|uniref:DUF521 domain protein n=1 Tax=Penicillium frequentans TaxID=3151616 RepID=A0AAD6CJB7_9EURO|nr:hypothetical protein N7494_011120 [Penicillium glabrum]
MAITDFGKEILLRGTPYVQGEASGKLVASDLELSFWGGVNPRTSEIIDRHHPLSGHHLEGSILAIPGGRGSCTGSTVMLELLLCDKAPKALVFERREDILTLGVIVAEEIFGKAIPVVALDPKAFRELIKSNGRLVYVADGQVSTKPLLDVATKLSPGTRENEPTLSVNDMNLTELDKTLLKGAYGDASRAAMRIVLRLASILGATELMDVTQVHVDGCVYTGPGSLAFAENLRDRGGKSKASVKSLALQPASWRMPTLIWGARPTFTCAPYQLDTAPKLGDQVAWAESNAVVYANSVLGARTMKYPDFLDISIALTGRAPKAGPHVQINRLASVIVKAPKIEKANVDDSFYPLLGYQVGNLATSQIPVVVGLEPLNPTLDDLKAFGAAFATVSSAPMFHMVGVTPEAPTLEAALSKGPDVRCVDVHMGDMMECWDSLNSASNQQPIDLVSLGNPHFSLAEITKLASLCRGRLKDKNVAVMVTCSRVTYASACKTGLTDELEAFGVQFITDTCWCMITEPTIPESQNAIMTNSGKYAHYGPGLTGKSFYFGSLARCVEAACGGDYVGRRPQWFESELQ